MIQMHTKPEFNFAINGWREIYIHKLTEVTYIFREYELGSDIYQNGCPIIESQKERFFTPEAVLMELANILTVAATDGDDVQIPKEYLFIDTGNTEFFKTGITVQGQPVVVSKDENDGKCFPHLGEMFVNQVRIKSTLATPAPF
jgi:hypothetical protein